MTARGSQVAKTREGYLAQSARHFRPALVTRKVPERSKQCRVAPQQAQCVGPMLARCWASVEDDGPTSAHHWANASFLLVGPLVSNAL